jgi:hypothetical protein
MFVICQRLEKYSSYNMVQCNTYTASKCVSVEQQRELPPVCIY